MVQLIVLLIKNKCFYRQPIVLCIKLKKGGGNQPKALEKTMKNAKKGQLFFVLLHKTKLFDKTPLFYATKHYFWTGRLAASRRFIIVDDIVRYGFTSSTIWDARALQAGVRQEESDNKRG